MRDGDRVSGLDFLVGGMPRAGTTVAAKFFSLHEDVFCYAGETHILPFLHDLFAYAPCHRSRVDMVLDRLRAQTFNVLLEMPRFSVERGAHPGNLVFDERSVHDTVAGIGALLRNGLYGRDLIEGAKRVVGEIIRDRVPRKLIGEKTPDNIFAMAQFGAEAETLPVVVVRDPVGVVRSMQTRAEDAGDRYNGRFSGEVERNVGLYLQYANACAACLRHDHGLLVRYEDLANDPAGVLTRSLGSVGRAPDDRAIAFVERGGDNEVADRAPMRYRRLTIDCGLGNLTETGYWKVMHLTHDARAGIGYDDEALAGMGFELPRDWPGDVVGEAVLPVAGFGRPNEHGNMWMGDSGILVAYLPRGKRRVGLSLWSDLPARLVQQTGASLLVAVGQSIKEAIPVESGARQTDIEIVLDEEDLTEMGTKGACALITLTAPFSYAPIAIGQDIGQARPVSFLWHGWSVA